MRINDNLRQLRLNRGMTQSQAAEQLGLTRQALSSYESGRTRPDIDTLMRLAEIYQTDLDEILYGQSRALKALRRIKITAAAVFSLLILLITISSAFLWCANRFFAVTGVSSAEEMAVWDFHTSLTGAWEKTDELILTISLFGFLLLIFLSAATPCRIDLRTKFLYTVTLSICLLAAPLLFGLSDPVFTLTDYMITPMFVIARAILFFIADLIIACVKRRRRKMQF